MLKLLKCIPYSLKLTQCVTHLLKLHKCDRTLLKLWKCDKHLVKLVTCIGILIYIYFNLFLLARSLTSKWGKSYFKVGQLWQAFISKYGKRYFRKGQRQLFQSRSKFISKWGSYFTEGHNVISKCCSYLKMEQLFQSGA